MLEWASLALGITVLLQALLLDAPMLATVPAHIGLACGIIAACRPTPRPVLTALAISVCSIAMVTPIIGGAIDLASETSAIIAGEPPTSTGSAAGDDVAAPTEERGGGVRLTSDTVQGSGPTEMALQPPAGSRIDQGLTIESDAAIRIEGLDASGNVVQTILDEPGAYDGSATWNNDPAAAIAGWRVTTDGDWNITFLLVGEMR